MEYKEIEKLQSLFNASIDCLLNAGIPKEKRYIHIVFSIIDLYNAVLKEKSFTPPEIEKIVNIAIDINFEYQSIFIDMMGYNFSSLYPDSQEIAWYSQQQSLVLKSSILWERMLNLIYFLAFHKDLTGNDNLDETTKIEELKTDEEKVIKKTVTKRRSKKKFFFNRISNLPINNPWRFILTYETITSEYDELLTNMEKHYHNTPLSKFALNNKENFDENAALRLLNQASNAVWENICNILTTGKAQIQHKDYWQLYNKEFKLHLS